MLERFLVDHRAEIVHFLRERIGSAQLRNGLPVFLDQLGDSLHRVAGDDVDPGDIGRSANLHGGDLLRAGLTVRQVVHDYGDVCQAVIEVALLHDITPTSEEFQRLNWCLDQAIAESVAEWSRLHDESIGLSHSERLGMLAHEMRNKLGAAIMAFDAIRSGRTAVGGATGALLARSLQGVNRLIDRTLADIRLEAGLERPEILNAKTLVDEVEIGARLQADSRGVILICSTVGGAWVFGDKQILAAAVSNLLQNGIKFTPKDRTVSLSVTVSGGNVLFDVVDGCGGLPPGTAENLFRPFVQKSEDRSGVGLGLSIVMKAAISAGGICLVRDIPGHGCVFTLQLPSVPPPQLKSISGGVSKHSREKKDPFAKAANGN